MIECVHGQTCITSVYVCMHEYVQMYVHMCTRSVFICASDESCALSDRMWCIVCCVYVHNYVFVCLLEDFHPQQGVFLQPPLS